MALRGGDHGRRKTEEEEGQQQSFVPCISFALDGVASHSSLRYHAT